MRRTIGGFPGQQKAVVKKLTEENAQPKKSRPKSQGKRRMQKPTHAKADAMKHDSRLAHFPLTREQHVFVTVWFNMTHAYSLDSHRVRVMPR
ncbi:hypothetical protein VSR68_40675 [Paraburkholderia phymatum]|uniref:hypothetical protein n=1 Tax=Paraburkholderia phymatum TaxID=148447 RepID=UPI00317DF34D